MNTVFSSKSISFGLVFLIYYLFNQLNEIPNIKLPAPTDVVQRKMNRKQFKKERKEWMKNMHRAAPGVDTEKINQAIRNEKHLLWTEAREESRPNQTTRQIPGDWFERGSNNLAGRIRTAIFDFDTDEIYCASSGGNIWRGNIDGTNWTSLNDYFQITGIHYLNRFDYNMSTRMIMSNGNQVYWTDDDCFTIHSATGLETVQDWGHIKRVVKSNNNFYLAALEWDYEEWTYLQSIYKSTDFGQTFTRIAELTSSNGFSVGGSNFDIWASQMGEIFIINDNACYQLQGDELNSVGTISTDDSGNNILIGGMENGTPFLHARIGSALYSSINGGISWQNNGELPTGTFTINSFECHPNQSNILTIGNIDGYYSTNSGSNWVLINNWWEYYSNPESYLHADLPEFNFVINPTTGEEFQFISTDGGLYISYDQFETVENISLSGLGVSQYYSTYTARTSPHHIFAGSQDQGFQLHLASEEPYDGVLDFEQTISGDYGHIVSTDGGISLWTDYPGFIMHYPNLVSSTTNYTWNFQGTGYLWLPPVVSDPYNSNIAYIGGGGINSQNHMVKVVFNNNSLSATDMAPSFPSKISAMAMSPVQQNNWFVSTENGQFFYSENNGESFTQTSSFTGPESHYFYGSSILPSPVNSDRVYIGGSGYSNPAVYLSENGGESFTPFNEGLPNTLVYGLAALPDESMIFAATAVGPYVFRASGGTWEDLSEGEAPDQTYWTVDYIPDINTVRFGTYGRGIWDYTFTFNPVIIPGDINEDSNVNIQDMLSLVSILLGYEDISDYALLSGDIDYSNSIDIFDLLLLVEIL